MGRTPPLNYPPFLSKRLVSQKTTRNFKQINRICAIRPGNLFQFCVRGTYIDLKSHEFGSAAKSIGSVVHLLLSPIQGMYPNPGHQSKGHHVLLRWCGFWSSRPALGTATKGGSTLLFWRCWLMKSRATNHWNSRRSLCIAAAILIGRWQIRCRWKAHDPHHRFGVGGR